MTSRVQEPVHDRHDRRRSLDRPRPVLAALYTGLALTVAATITPYVDRATGNTLAGHIRAGYPTYTQARVDTAVTTYEVMLTVIGVLGVAGWAIIIRAVTTGSRWAALLATGMVVLGAGVALAGLLVEDTSGETGLSPLLGWVGILPCLPGLLAVTLLWTSGRHRGS
jgi:hypothetical protein